MSARTALALQFGDDRGNRQQIVLFPTGAIVRRSLAPHSRTAWRRSETRHVVGWAQGYVSMATSSASTPLRPITRPTEVEVTEAELAMLQRSTAGVWAIPDSLAERMAAVFINTDATLSTDEVQQIIADWFATPTPEPEPGITTLVWCMSRHGYADDSFCRPASGHVHYDVEVDDETGRVLTDREEQARRRVRATGTAELWQEIVATAVYSSDPVPETTRNVRNHPAALEILRRAREEPDDED